MKNNRLALLLIGILAICILAGGAYMYTSSDSSKNRSEKNGDGKKKKKAKKDEEEPASDATGAACVDGTLTAEQIWELPKELLEVSGITWLSEDKVAVVEDNQGAIFIYDLQAKKIERKLNFGPLGDYEGIAHVNGAYFVVKSDGKLFEVSSAGKLIKQYNLPLSEVDNIETLYFDAPNKRLILGQKDGKKGSSVKHFYSFDLAARKFDPNPIFSVALTDEIVNCGQVSEEDGKKKGKKKGNGAEIRPSELAIHPQTKEVYIADGPNQRILVLSPDFKPKHYLAMDKKEFPQVEGLMFSPTGELYVSTEGTKNPAKISRMQLDEKQE